MPSSKITATLLSVFLFALSIHGSAWSYFDTLPLLERKSGVGAVFCQGKFYFGGGKRQREPLWTLWRGTTCRTRPYLPTGRGTLWPSVWTTVTSCSLV